MTDFWANLQSWDKASKRIWRKNNSKHLERSNFNGSTVICNDISKRIIQYRTRGFYCYKHPSISIFFYLQHVLQAPPSALPPPGSEPLLWFSHLIWMLCNSFLTSPSASALTRLQLILHRKMQWYFKIKIWSHHLLSFFILSTGFPLPLQERPKGWTSHRILACYSPCLLCHFHPAHLGSCHVDLLLAP